MPAMLERRISECCRHDRDGCGLHYFELDRKLIGT